MPAVKNPPATLVRTTTKRDGEEGKIVVAEGSPLARLQAVHDDPEALILAGDINDVCGGLDQKDEVVARLVKLTGNKKKGETVSVKPQDVEYVTALLVAN